MPFAIALLIVVLFSLAVLLPQYWNGAMSASDDSARGDEPRRLDEPTAAAQRVRRDAAA